jgi:hypothetical protein
MLRQSNFLSFHTARSLLFNLKWLFTYLCGHNNSANFATSCRSCSRRCTRRAAPLHRLRLYLLLAERRPRIGDTRLDTRPRCLRIRVLFESGFADLSCPSICRFITGLTAVTVVNLI